MADENWAVIGARELSERTMLRSETKTKRFGEAEPRRQGCRPQEWRYWRMCWYA